VHAPNVGTADELRKKGIVMSFERPSWWRANKVAAASAAEIHAAVFVVPSMCVPSAAGGFAAMHDARRRRCRQLGHPMTAR